MNAKFNDHQDPASSANDHYVNSDDAVRLLRSLQARKPFFCSLDTTAGTLLVGVGAEAGCVQFTPTSGGPPYLMATVDGGDMRGEYVEFLSAGTPSPIPTRYILPWRLVEEIVVHFIDHGVIPSRITWEEI